MATPSQSETVVNMQEEEDSGGKMSLFEHLVELRKRLLHSVGAVGIGMVVGLAASRPIMDFILRPIQAALRANHLDDNVFSFSLQGYVGDRKSTRLNSSHMSISYAVFCLKKKKNNRFTVIRWPEPGSFDCDHTTRDGLHRGQDGAGAR